MRAEHAKYTRSKRLHCMAYTFTAQKSFVSWMFLPRQNEAFRTNTSSLIRSLQMRSVDLGVLKKSKREACSCSKSTVLDLVVIPFRMLMRVFMSPSFLPELDGTHGLERTATNGIRSSPAKTSQNPFYALNWPSAKFANMSSMAPAHHAYPLQRGGTYLHSAVQGPVKQTSTDFRVPRPAGTLRLWNRSFGITLPFSQGGNGAGWVQNSGLMEQQFCARSKRETSLCNRTYA
jgi:hypothetical protein